MSDVTRILNAIEGGDTRAADKLLPLVYEELRLLAAQKRIAGNYAAEYAEDSRAYRGQGASSLGYNKAADLG